MPHYEWMVLPSSISEIPPMILLMKIGDNKVKFEAQYSNTPNLEYSVFAHGHPW